MPQAGVITDAVETLPTNPALRAKAERVLLKQTRTLTATELTKTGRHIAAVVDPEGEERAVEAALDREERAAHLGRFLSVVGDGAGGVRIKGYGSTEDGETIRAALLPLTKPAPARDPDDPTCETERDPRDHGARMWDALVHTAQHALDTEMPPESHGTVPRVVVTTTLDALHNGSAPPVSRARPRPGSSSPPPRSAGSPATPTSSPASSGQTDRSSTSAAPTASSPRPSGSPWSSETATAPSPAAPARPRCATPTTSPTGPTAAPHHCTTWSCSAENTTASSTTPPGRYASPETTDPSSCPHPDPATPPNGSDTGPGASDGAIPRITTLCFRLGPSRGRVEPCGRPG